MRLSRQVFMTQTLPLGTKFQSLDNFLSYLRGAQRFIKIWKLEPGLREHCFQCLPYEVFGLNFTPFVRDFCQITDPYSR